MSPNAKCDSCGSTAGPAEGQTFARCPNNECTKFNQLVLHKCPQGSKYVVVICRDTTYFIVNKKTAVIECPCCQANHVIDSAPYETISGQQIVRSYLVGEVLARGHAEFQLRNLLNAEKEKAAALTQKNQELEAEMESLEVVQNMMLAERNALLSLQGEVKVEPGEEAPAVALVPFDDKTRLQMQVDLLTERNLSLEKEVREKAVEMAANTAAMTILSYEVQSLKEAGEKHAAESARFSSELQLALSENKKLQKAQMDAQFKTKYLEGELKSITENEDYQLWKKAREHKAFFEVYMKQAQKSLGHADELGKKAMERIEEMRNICGSSDSTTSPANEASPASVESPDQLPSSDVARKRDPLSSPSKLKEFTVPLKIRRDGNTISFDFSSVGQTLPGNTGNSLDFGKFFEKIVEQGQSEETKKAVVTEASGIEEEPEESSGEEKNSERIDTSCEEQESQSSEVSVDSTEASGEEPIFIEASQEDEKDEWPEDFTFEMDESTWFDSCDQCYLVDEEDHRPARG